jgi:hypothetical protein
MKTETKTDESGYVILQWNAGLILRWMAKKFLAFLEPEISLQ